jgi:YD repeat-containing protein
MCDRAIRVCLNRLTEEIDRFGVTTALEFHGAE